MSKSYRRSTLSLLVLLFSCLPCIAADKALPPIIPADTLPETTPWDLKELSTPPEFEWDEGTAVRSLYYKSEPYKGKPTRVFAYYATPGTLAGDTSKDKNLPAVVLVHGGGGRAFEKWVELWAKRGYAAIAMDLGARGLGAKPNPDGGPGQGHKDKFETIVGPLSDQWTFHAVANVIRAHSLIRSFPEVDHERTALTGISWGGYLTCIVAGLDNRFKAAVPVYGCGFLHENSCWGADFAKMTPENKAKWVRLWDPSMYVGSAAMPMLFVNGGTDFAYPPDSYAKTYALVKSPKNLRFSPHLSHGHIFDRPKAIELYIAARLRDGVGLPRIATPVVAEEKVTATVESPTKLSSAALHYTTDKLPGNNGARKWITKEAELKENRITADAAPQDATIWFLTVTDEREVMVASELVIADGK